MEGEKVLRGKYSPSTFNNMSILNKTNKMLEQYGHNIKGNPIFRVVWSDDQFENRKGQYNEFSGEIFLRTYIGVKRVKKYPTIKGRWVFEKWLYGITHPDLPDNKDGSYECIYIFQTNEGKPLPLDLDIVQFIAKGLSEYVDKSKNKQIIEDQLTKKEKELDTKEELVLEDASPLMASNLHTGRAVTVLENKNENEEK